MSGKTITYFLMEGTLRGRVKCTISNLIGIGYRFPKTELDKFKDKDEDNLRQSGIYFLFGTNDDTGKKAVYVGQAGDIFNRLKNHSKSSEKDYWAETVVLTTRDNSFGFTEISWLEKRFFELANKSDRYIIKNANEPNAGNVQKEKESELRTFLDNFLIIMEVLGHVFDPLNINVPNKRLPEQPQQPPSTKTRKTAALQLHFWENFKKYLQSQSTKLKIRTPRPQHWYDFSIGNSHCLISCIVSFKDNFVRCDLYLANNKELYRKLYSRKPDIERELGFSLDWQPLKTAKASRIAYKNNQLNLQIDDDKEKSFKWLKETAEKYSEVIPKYLRGIPQTNTKETEAHTDEQILYLKRKKRSVNAKCKRTSEGFIVLKGSQVSLQISDNAGKSTLAKRKSAKIDENGILLEDILFASPSGASNFVIGNASNGYTEWKDKDGQTLERILAR